MPSGRYARASLEITRRTSSLHADEGTVFLVEMRRRRHRRWCCSAAASMRFSPAPTAERGQLRLFAGAETLDAPFETAFVRLSPSDYRRSVAAEQLRRRPTDADGRAPRAGEYSSASAEVVQPRPAGLSRDDWYLLPQAGDFLAEVDTRRHRHADLSRGRRRRPRTSACSSASASATIALYASADKLAARGRFYSDDALRDYDVLDYNIEPSITRSAQCDRARARLAIRVQRTSLGDADAAAGRNADGERRHQRRVRAGCCSCACAARTPARQPPAPVPQDSDLTLVVATRARLDSQELDIDTDCSWQPRRRRTTSRLPSRAAAGC